MLDFRHTTSEDADFRALVVLLDRELGERYGAAQEFYSQFNKLDTIPHALVALRDGHAVGCGAIRPYSDDAVEIKRMFVLPELRGQGIAAAVLAALENRATELGFRRCVLETGNKQPEAIRLYQKSGYRIIPNFGQYADDESSVCMEKNVS